MSKSPLRKPYADLATDVIETMLAWHHLYRPDLPYPNSHSDMLGAVEGLFMMYEVRRRPIALRIEELREDREDR